MCLCFYVLVLLCSYVIMLLCSYALMFLCSYAYVLTLFFEFLCFYVCICSLETKTHKTQGTRHKTHKTHKKQNTHKKHKTHKKQKTQKSHKIYKTHRNIRHKTHKEHKTLARKDIAHFRPRISSSANGRPITMHCQRHHLVQISTSKRRVGLYLWRTFAEFLMRSIRTHIWGWNSIRNLGPSDSKET